MKVKLKDFIKEALLNITSGVEEANREKKRFKIIGEKHESGMEGNFVNFDVSVVVNEETGSEIDGEARVSWLSVISAGVGSKIDESIVHQNTHRLSFKVYISEK